MIPCIFLAAFISAVAADTCVNFQDIKLTGDPDWAKDLKFRQSKAAPMVYAQHFNGTLLKDFDDDFRVKITASVGKLKVPVIISKSLKEITGNDMIMGEIKKCSNVKEVLKKGKYTGKNCKIDLNGLAIPTEATAKVEVLNNDRKVVLQGEGKYKKEECK